MHGAGLVSYVYTTSSLKPCLVTLTWVRKQHRHARGGGSSDSKPRAWSWVWAQHLEDMS